MWDSRWKYTDEEEAILAHLVLGLLLNDYTISMQKDLGLVIVDTRRHDQISIELRLDDGRVLLRGWNHHEMKQHHTELLMTDPMLWQKILDNLKTFFGS